MLLRTLEQQDVRTAVIPHIHSSTLPVFIFHLVIVVVAVTPLVVTVFTQLRLLIGILIDFNGICYRHLPRIVCQWSGHRHGSICQLGEIFRSNAEGL